MLNEPQPSALITANKFKVLFLYLLMIAIAVTIFMLIRSIGEHLSAPQLPVLSESQRSSASNINILLHVLLTLTVVIVTARIMGGIFGWIQQPPVIGEMIGGILLGPSLLGSIAPEISAYLIPVSIMPTLSIVAQLGVILFMFLVGLELDLRVILKSGHATLAISHASIIVPFLLGATLALGIYPVMANGHSDFTVFALFMGVSLSVTAFPVLARILTDRAINKTKMGTIALTAAAVDDVSAWCLLGLVVSLANSEESGTVAQAKISPALLTILLTIVFVLFVLLLIRPLMKRLIPLLERSPELTRTGMAILFVAMLLSAVATEYIGIHAIFGAFLLGAVIPHDSRVASELTHRLDDLLAVFFLPIFFVFTGMRTHIGLVTGAQNWIICGIILLVACLGKYGGTFVAARLMGLNGRDASALGILMNTRGLVELVVLNIGLDLGVISPTLFAMLVLMALVTTFITTPILHLHLRNHPWNSDREKDVLHT